MATLVHSYGAFEPPEVTYTTPTICANPDCQAEWDEDTHSGSHIAEMDGANYCTDSDLRCIQNAAIRAYRREAAALVESAMDDLAHELGHLDRMYPCDTNDPGDPTAILDDFRLRAKLFGLGTDNGWRDGLMLDSTEFYGLTALLCKAAAALVGPATEIATELLAQANLLDDLKKRTAEGVAL